MPTFDIHITLRTPENVTNEDVKDYVADAVGTWGGQYHPEDPRFRLGDDIDVTVRRPPRKKKDNLSAWAKPSRLLPHREVIEET